MPVNQGCVVVLMIPTGLSVNDEERCHASKGVEDRALDEANCLGCLYNRGDRYLERQSNPEQLNGVQFQGEMPSLIKSAPCSSKRSPRNAVTTPCARADVWRMVRPESWCEKAVAASPSMMEGNSTMTAGALARQARRRARQ